MNDERSGQLTADWLIPAYARDYLGLVSPSDRARTEGERGLFELSSPAQRLNLHWAAPDGPILTQLRWQADSLAWDGSARVGGTVEALHLMTLPALDSPLLVMHVDGQPLRPPTQPYLPADRRNAPLYPLPDFFEGVDEDTEPTTTTWLMAYDSALAAVAQDALATKLRLHCYGHLAEDDQGWAAHFALPLLLASATLFAT